jgi:hypothetical protein
LPYIDVGNNYGIGEERKRELRGSCEALAIDKGRCAVLDHPDIQDSPTVWWKEELIESIARDYIKKWNVDAVSLPFQFDHFFVLICLNFLKRFYKLTFLDHHLRPRRSIGTHQSPSSEYGN